MSSKQNRISIISQIIESETVRSQNDIIERLSQRGIMITQASLSRYLKEIQASRIPDGANGYIYKISPEASKSTAILSNEVVSVEFAGNNMAVLKTISGYANAVSAQIDAKMMPPIAGTISGDDTILIIIRDGFSKRQVKEYLVREFLQSLGVPARRNVNDSVVQRGEQMFYQAKCHLCHVTTLHTKVGGSVLLNGTRLPWLGNQTIHPYSDFLLHDMGSEIMGVGLNDNFVSGLARGNEWRTTPLWGVGLQEKVNAHTYFLHDGRARNFVEAIMWHGGEGEASKNLFKNMNKNDRMALVAFLNSL